MHRPLPAVGTRVESKAHAFASGAAAAEPVGDGTPDLSDPYGASPRPGPARPGRWEREAGTIYSEKVSGLSKVYRLP